MVPVFDRIKIDERILAGLARSGTSSLADLYGFCGAKDGGQQHFVRQRVRELAASCKLRRQGTDVYALGTRAGTIIVDPPAAPPAEPPRPAPPIEAKPEPPAAPEPQDEARPAAEAAVTETNDDPNAGAGDVPTPVRAARRRRATADETHEEAPMRTQTEGKKDGKNGKHPAAETKPANKTEWTLAAVRTMGTARFSDLFARAKKEKIFDEQKQLGATLCALTKRKALKKIERGVYTMPGAKVVYDAEKPAAPKKRTAEDVRKAVETKKAAVSAKAEEAKPKKAGAKRQTKAGRKPSLLRPVYDRIDANIEASVAAIKKSTDGIREIDAKIKALKEERAELVRGQAEARKTFAALRDSRKKVAALAAGISEALRI